MGCEFSDKVRIAKQRIVKELYNELTGPHKAKFVSLYGFPEQTAESETYKAYYHCKRVLKRYPMPERPDKFCEELDLPHAITKSAEGFIQIHCPMNSNMVTLSKTPKCCPSCGNKIKS